MNNKKQSSIEWLAEIVSKMGYISTDILEQAKEMHKQDIEDAWLDGVANWDSEKEAEQYYTKTFGGQDETNSI
jgi:hypothetical protein